MRKKNTSSQSLARYPYWIGLIVLAVLSAVIQVAVIADSFFPLLNYELDAVSSVMSTCSEVIAGLYGITLTGYIFFADRFQDTGREDESLYDVVQALLLRYNHMAGFISLLCLLCIITCEGIVLYGGNTLLPEPAYRFWVNESLLMVFWSCNFILYFVITVLDPQKVGRISRQKKARLSEESNTGDTQAFLADWKAIEEILYQLREELLATVRFIPGGSAKTKPETIRMLDTLRNYGRISNGLWQKLNKLRLYYNLTIHDPSAVVSAEMCALAQEVLAELKKKLSQQ